MPKTTFLAIDPAGETHTRKTDRVYTHAVLTRGSREWALDRAAGESYAANLRHAAEQFLHATWTVERFNTMLRAKRCEILCRDNIYATQRIAEAKAFVAKWGTPAAYADDLKATELARIEAKDYAVWGVAGFCGRRDLAEKLAATERAKVWNGDVVIVNAMKR